MSRARTILLGKPKDIYDPALFHKITLGAFFAWVGLGADGLSSSSYGPEEAFLSLAGHHVTYLALPLALMTALTIFIVSASYSQIIKLFPTGGGGYLVASKLLGPRAGLVSGAALLVDYMLTISMSISSAGDQLFSFFPQWLAWKFPFQVFLVLVLIVMNLRGIKESVITLTPIFVSFVVLHIIFIGYGLFHHADELGPLVYQSFQQTAGGVQQFGFAVIFLLFMKAYSLGAGTYTGIEAVSNGLPILRNPKVQTGRRTMLYMAVSLSLTAGGLLFCYELNHVMHQQGKTMNAALFEGLANNWHFAGMPVGPTLVLLTLVSEAALLFVAAQTGFLDGPRVLANMALDKWVPGRFANLSEQLVTQNGVVLMGVSSLLFLLWAHGNVRVLVVLYAINVFLTFSMSQFGMVRHWLANRRTEPGWLRNLGINGIGLILTLTILCVIVALKFAEGAWLTVVVTLSLAIVCMLIRRHYRGVESLVSKLDDTLLHIPPLRHAPASVMPFEHAPTAALLVNGYNGMGIHSFLSIHVLFPNYFKNFIFLSVGVLDSTRFKGAAEMENLRKATEEDLKKYVQFATSQGLYGEYEYKLGTDAISDLEELCAEVNRKKHPRIFFAGQLIFPRENLWTRLLHNQTAFALLRRLQFAGMHMVVLPIRVR